MDKEWNDDADQELSPWGNTSQELCPCEEVRGQWQEEVRVQWEVGVRVLCGGRTQQKLYHWEENVTVQELHPWNEDDDRYQELSQLEGAGYQDLPLLEDVRGHLHMYQWETDKRDPDLSQVGDHSDKVLSQGKGYNVKELPQWEKDKSDQKLSQQEESVNSQGCPNGEKDDEVPLSGTENPVPAPHSPPDCSQTLLDLARHITSEVVSKAVLEVQASGQQPEEQGDREQSVAELEAAAPVERKESPISALLSPCCPHSPSPSPLGTQALSEQQEEGDRGSVLSEQESKKGTVTGELELSQCDDEEDPEFSQQEMNKYQEISQGEICVEQELSPGEAGSYLELFPGEVCVEQELSPGEAGSYLELFPGEVCVEQELSPGEAGSYPELFPGEVCVEQELSPGEAGSYLELSPGEVCMEQELSPAEAGSYLEFSECLEKGLSQEVGSSKKLLQKLLSWEEYSEQELSHKVSSYQELSDWEESIG
ncbi:hypothetical protein DUI87_28119 [Hirundo rustica rustica]|uniref:Uncharacterized protein n=1 Tax=Hirundo rustica rustica TaxID=333673 RepID=A0A3M0J3A2_HIRRU|nr:hypothetical protein DUI87_28119 [Hirundo rustica rustica]